MPERTSCRGSKDGTEKESRARVAIELPVKCKMLPYPLRHCVIVSLNSMDGKCCQAHGCATKAQTSLVAEMRTDCGMLQVACGGSLSTGLCSEH